MGLERIHIGSNPSSRTTKLFMDEVEASLIKEIEELEMTSGRLLKALQFSQRQLQSVTSSKILLEHDINLKSKTIHIDEVQVLGLRSTVVIDQC
ncbi:hypothetical protein Avbf_14329 [Armadillidium vulgare]|nr:hypothetical protein Avbf_14329 [Armadillidium vulgare]